MHEIRQFNWISHRNARNQIEMLEIRSKSSKSDRIQIRGMIWMNYSPFLELNRLTDIFGIIRGFFSCHSKLLPSHSYFHISNSHFIHTGWLQYLSLLEGMVPVKFTSSLGTFVTEPVGVCGRMDGADKNKSRIVSKERIKERYVAKWRFQWFYSHPVLLEFAYENCSAAWVWKDENCRLDWH